MSICALVHWLDNKELNNFQENKLNTKVNYYRLKANSLGLRLKPPEEQTLKPKQLKPSNKCLKAHGRLEGEDFNCNWLYDSILIT